MKLKKFIASLLAVTITAVSLPMTQYGIEAESAGFKETASSNNEAESKAALDTWEANFVFNEATGELSWDAYDDRRQDIHYVVYVDRASDSTYDNEVLFTGNTKQNECKTKLMAKLAFYDLFTGADTDEFTVYIRAGEMNSDEMVIAESSDRFTINYDGCDMTDQLTAPVLQHGYCNGTSIRWKDTEGAIVYFFKTPDDFNQDLITDDYPYGSCYYYDPDNEFKGIDDNNETLNQYDWNWSECLFQYQVCSVNANGDRSEWSEPYELWNANFMFDENTGILSWDEGTPVDIDGRVFCYAFQEYVRHIFYFSYLSDKSVHKPNVNISLFLAEQSIARTNLYNTDEENPNIMTGDISIRLCSADGVEASANNFIINYDGCDINPDLAPPSNITVNSSECSITWDDADGAVGYVFKKTAVTDELIYNALSYCGKIGKDKWYSLERGEEYIACSVDVKGDRSEWSEPFIISEPEPEIWQANFVYNETTGILSWDPYEGFIDDEHKYEICMQNSEGDYISSFGGMGWGDLSLEKPNANIPVNLALTLSEFTGDIVYTVEVRNNDNETIISSSDSFTYSYDGCDIKEELEIPVLYEYIENDKTAGIEWNATKEAVGYLIYDNNENRNVSFVPTSNEKNNISVLGTLSVCAVDINGDISKWSEPVTVTEFEPDTWKANFYYNETTGNLYWDQYNKLNVNTGFSYKLSVNDGDPTYGFTYKFDENDKPYVNLPLEFAEASLDIKEYPSESHTFVPEKSNILKAYAIRDDNYNSYDAISEDSFLYEFNGGNINDKLTPPTITNASLNYTNDFVRTIYVEVDNLDKEAIGYIIKASNENSHSMFSADYNYLSQFFIMLYGNEYDLSVCAVDIDGNVSEWSEPVHVKYDPTDENGFFVYNFTPKSAIMQVVPNQWSEEHELISDYDLYFKMPGVTEGETTIGELKELYKGIYVNGYQFIGSDIDITQNDIITTICIQTDNGDYSYSGWNAVYNTDKMAFDTDVSVDDSDIIRQIFFRVSVNKDAIERNNLKSGDTFTVYFYLDKEYEYEGNIFFYYEKRSEVTIAGGIIKNPKVVIPSEIKGKPVTEIGMNAFYMNKVMETLVIPENVKRLDWFAFNTCENLTEVTLPQSLEYIDSWVFERCYSLKTINVPKNVTHVGGGAFAQSTSLTSITCDPGNNAYVSVDGVLFTKDMKELNAYPVGRNGDYTVPASVNHIGDAAFYGSKGLSSVEILGSLNFVGFEAFAECELLTDVSINDGVEYVGYWAFRGCKGIKLLTVPQSVSNIGDQAFGFQYTDSKFEDFTLRGYKNSAIYFYALRHNIPFIIIGDADGENNPFKEENKQEAEVETNPSAKPEDSIVSVTVNPGNMKDKSDAGAGINLADIKIKAREIYDEEGIARVEEALGESINKNKQYNILDLTLWNGDKDYSNGYDGLVEVIIPIPSGHRDKTFYCYRIVDNNGKPEKELIPGKQTEDSYIIYLEHFSIYAFVGESKDGHTHVFGKSWESDKDAHWHECSCGEKSDESVHSESEWIIDKEVEGEENGLKHKECTVCGRIISEEEIPAVTTPESSAPEESAPEESTPEGSTPEESNSEESTPEVSTPEESIPEATAPAITGSLGFSIPSSGNNNSGSTNGETVNSETTAPSIPNDTTAAITVKDGSDNGNINDNSSQPTAASETKENNIIEQSGNNEDKNLNTGVPLAILPVVTAAASIVLFKKKK